MEKFISLATDPDFQPFQWSWPGNHQPMHATMIMLIDLYERPYSPEAPKSRAFVDKIFSLTGPDGGVVGGEDGVTTQRPLKDGGREAWDMIRRLRQQAWQKAGLDPQKLWTEQAQIQAGVAVPDDCLATKPYYPGSSAYLQPIHSREQLLDFSKMFYNMTRSQALPSIATALGTTVPLPRPSSSRYEIPSTTASAHTGRTMPHPETLHSPVLIPKSPSSPADINMPHPQLLHAPKPTTVSHSPSPGNIQMPTATAPPTGLAPPTHARSPAPAPGPAAPAALPTLPPLSISSTAQAQQSQPQPQTTLSFIDTLSPSAQQIPLSVPTPPSMVDPNLNFDWDQWDAVFGQHLPVSDDLMELDPVTGFEFGDLGVPERTSRAGSLNGGDSGIKMGGAGTGAGSTGMRSPGWC